MTNLKEVLNSAKRQADNSGVPCTLLRVFDKLIARTSCPQVTL